MADIQQMSVELREGSGKGAARQTRREGLVPGVIYGDKRDPASIKMDRRMLERELHQGGFFSKLYDLEAGGKSQRVLPRDVQFDVVTDVPIHVDFLRVAVDAVVTINVPLNYLNEEECEGLKQGGVLNVVRHEIEVVCRADAIPQSFDVDLRDLQMGDSLHISAISMPDGVELTITDRDFTVLTIAAPAAKIEDEVAEGEEGLEAADTESVEGDEEAGDEEGDSEE
jgi:large subunit ribosomal protein L25